MMRAMIRRQREQISSVELLAVLMRAAGQSPAQHTDPQAEAAVEELLGFILEVRYPHAAGEENKSPLMRPAKDAEEFKPSRVGYVEPSRNVTESAYTQTIIAVRSRQQLLETEAAEALHRYRKKALLTWKITLQ